MEAVRVLLAMIWIRLVAIISNVLSGLAETLLIIRIPVFELVCVATEMVLSFLVSIFLAVVELARFLEGCLGGVKRELIFDLAVLVLDDVRHLTLMLVLLN